MLADELDYVVGVDPHRDRHALAVLEVRSGAVVCEAAVAASAAGYRRALELVGRQAPGRRCWAIEGSGSYGAGLARALARVEEQVVEVGRLRRDRASQAKTDALDAARAARSVLAAKRLASPRGLDPRQEALRALVVTREGALQARTAALCQLRALIVTSPEPLRARLSGLTRSRLLASCRRLRPGDSDHAGMRLALKTLAARIEALTLEEQQLKQEIERQLAELAPILVAQPGIGPISAARILLAWSHQGRLHSEAAFARLAGAAPVPASSGKKTRYRLDRGGDRQLNRALHTIILNRRKNHPPTIDYLSRRQHDGKTSREAIRCLKRYLARSLFRLLETMPQTT
jgi:transposase